MDFVSSAVYHNRQIMRIIFKSLSTALTKSRNEAIMCIPQIVIYVIVEKGMEHKGKLWLNHDASVGVAAVVDKTLLRMK